MIEIYRQQLKLAILNAETKILEEIEHFISIQFFDFKIEALAMGLNLDKIINHAFNSSITFMVDEGNPLAAHYVTELSQQELSENSKKIMGYTFIKALTVKIENPINNPFAVQLSKEELFAAQKKIKITAENFKDDIAKLMSDNLAEIFFTEFRKVSENTDEPSLKELIKNHEFKAPPTKLY